VFQQRFSRKAAQSDVETITFIIQDGEVGKGTQQQAFANEL